MAFGETHAAAVDRNGDVYQWGIGHSPETKPNLTLKGKGIVQVACTSDKVYCLSKSGQVYFLHSEHQIQTTLCAPPTSFMASWLSIDSRLVETHEPVER